MNTDETRTTLGGLQYLQQRAVEMMDEALPLILDGEAAAQIGQYREDHARWSQELSGMLSRFGGPPLSPPRGFEQMEREYDRLLHESGRQDEALEALLLLEEGAAATYGLAVALELPEDAAVALRSQLDEEQRHVKELQERVGTLPVEIAGGGVGMDHMFVDDKSPDDFDTQGIS